MSGCFGCAMLTKAREAQETMTKLFPRLDMGFASVGSSTKLCRGMPIICIFCCPRPDVIHTCRANLEKCKMFNDILDKHVLKYHVDIAPLGPDIPPPGQAAGGDTLGGREMHILM